MKPAFGYCTTRDRMGAETFSRVSVLGGKYEAPIFSIAERADDDKVFIFGWKLAPSVVDRELAKDAMAEEIAAGRVIATTEWVP